MQLDHYQILQEFACRRYQSIPYDEVVIYGVSSGTVGRRIREIQAMGYIDGVMYNNQNTGKRYKVFNITRAGLEAIKKERKRRGFW